MRKTITTTPPEEFRIHKKSSSVTGSEPSRQTHQQNSSKRTSLTHKDFIRAEDKEKFIEEYKQKILVVAEREGLSMCLSAERIYAVDNTETDDIRFIDLRKHLFQMITNQTIQLGKGEMMREAKIWGLEWPIRWLKWESELIPEETQEPVKHLNYDDVMQSAAASGINEGELASFLEFHHAVGDFLHYSEAKGIIVTDPQWLVDAFKVFIKPIEFFNNQMQTEENNKTPIRLISRGKVDGKDLKNFWKDKDVEFLKELMTSFNLFLPLRSTKSEERFLIPCKLPRKEIHVQDTEPFSRMANVYSSEHQPSREQGPPCQFPAETFSKLLSSFARKWDIIEDKYLSYGYASFEISDNLTLTLTQSWGTSVKVGIWCSEDDAEFPSNHRILEIRNAVCENLHTCQVPKSEKFQMLCPHWMPGDNATSAMERFQEKKDLRTKQMTVRRLKDKCSCQGKRPDPKEFYPGLFSCFFVCCSLRTTCQFSCLIRFPECCPAKYIPLFAPAVVAGCESSELRHEQEIKRVGSLEESKLFKSVMQ